MLASVVQMPDHQHQAEYVRRRRRFDTNIQVTINPLNDVSRVRVVEAALVAIQGVEAVALQTLSGDTAELQVEVQEDVSLIGGLRRTCRSPSTSASRTSPPSPSLSAQRWLSRVSPTRSPQGP